VYLVWHLADLWEAATESEAGTSSVPVPPSSSEGQKGDQEKPAREKCGQRSGPFVRFASSVLTTIDPKKKYRSLGARIEKILAVRRELLRSSPADTSALWLSAVVGEKQARP